MPAPATVPPPQPVPSTSSQSGASSGTTTTIKTTATPASTGTQPSSSAPQQQGPPSVSIGEGAPPPQAPPPVKPPASAVSGAGIGSGAGTAAPPSAAAPANSSQPQNGQEPAGNSQEGTSASGGQDQGQSPSSQEGGAFVFRKQVEEVILHATVLDDKQRMVTNLPKIAFTVFENNQPQTISSFRHEDIPVAMGIVIDNSGSMREKRDKVNKAAINLVRASNSQDEVFVVNFNDEYYLDQDFTGATPKLRDALEKVESRGGTALYDFYWTSVRIDQH